mmetsp:Transcript_24731/g.54257  ORF Transcript_24731/g.54257 Transcript_24731/m.54257 type:complete len:537 (+) Transcript_24731:226-1836(+)
MEALTGAKCESDPIDAAEVQEALDRLQTVVAEDLQSAVIAILPSTALAENATNEIIAAIDTTRARICGLEALNIGFLSIAANDTSRVIQEVSPDLRDGITFEKTTAVLKIMFVITLFGTACGGPAVVLVAGLVGAFCRLIVLLLEHLDEKRNPEDTAEGSLRRVIEEVTKTQIFEGQLAMCKGKILGMSNRLGDLQRYCKNPETMTIVHYNMITQSDYLDDGEEFLETLMHFIQQEIKIPDDAQKVATLIYAYTTTALVRTQQLNNLVVLCKKFGDNFLLESVCQRLRDRYTKDKERFAWLQRPPDSSNGLLYAQVMALSHSRRVMIEAYVGKFPGHLCLLKSRHRSEFCEMKPNKKSSGAYKGNTLLRTSSRGIVSESHSPGSESMFIFYCHNQTDASITNQESDEATCSIFSVGNAGYIRPDTNFKYITATSSGPKDKRCLWKCKGLYLRDKMCELMPFDKPHYRLAKSSADHLGGLFGSSPLHLVKKKPKKAKHLMREDAFFPPTKSGHQETRIVDASVNVGARQHYPVVIID